MAGQIAARVAAKVAVGLVHFPVVDKAGSVVCTNVTNLDVHDIARACRVFGVERYYVINPMKEQIMFVSRLLDFWRSGYGADYNHMRRTALTMVHLAHTIEEAVKDWGCDPVVVTTSARDRSDQVTFRDLRGQLSERPHFILFGTGFGLTDDVFQGTIVLEPIRGASDEDYRHLSVRSAVSICLDRLLTPC